MLLVLTATSVSGAEIDWNSVAAGGSLGGDQRLGATIGGGGANTSAAPGVMLVGGFWAIMRARAAASRTPTATVTPSASATTSATPTTTATASANATATVTATFATPTATSTARPDATPTATAFMTVTGSPTPTPTATAPPPCIGDCNDDGEVRVDELVALVNITLDLQGLDACPAGDRSGDGRVTIDEVLVAVNHALGRCPATGELP